jgi:hypothetical protein
LILARRLKDELLRAKHRAARREPVEPDGRNRASLALPRDHHVAVGQLGQRGTLLVKRRGLIDRELVASMERPGEHNRGNEHQWANQHRHIIKHRN